MRLSLYEPDIPQNLGAFIRLAACLGTPLDIIEPCGFPVDDKRIRRAAMDYYELATVVRHASWRAFQQDRPEGRVEFVVGVVLVHDQSQFCVSISLLSHQCYPVKNMERKD